jgi:hypothetical protein
MESIEQTFNGVANFGKRVQCTISRNGDLISRVYLQATLPSVEVLAIVNPSATTLLAAATDATKFSWVENVGQALINYVELEIGGQLIDKHYGDWMYIWNELTLPVGKQAAFDMMVGSGLIPSSDGPISTLGSANSCTTCGSVEPGACNVNAGAGLGTVCSKGDGNANLSASTRCSPEYTLYVPLEFWFCRHSGLALPLIALQYHEVKVNIQFATLNNLCNITPAGAAVSAGNAKKVYNAVNQSGLVAASLWADYVYLDTEERRRFAQVAHEYLIEQLQFTGAESVTAAQNNIKMSFNHPVKELVWVTQLDQNVDCDYGSTGGSNRPFNYADDSQSNPTAVAKIQLNGHDRFDARFGSYFNFVQPYQHHTRSPAIGVNVYSFALKPEEHQPSGTCNFSRIDNAVLNLTLSPYTLKASYNHGTVGGVATPAGTALTAQVRIYAVNYNVLRVMSGMGGLAYSN